MNRKCLAYSILSILCIVLFLTSTSTASQKKTKPESAVTKVNINTADGQELETLPGVGKSLAERIIKHRNAMGPFKTPQDLMAVKGIGQKKLDGMIEFVSVKQ